MITPPETDEFDPYYQTYISLVPPGGLLEMLDAQDTGLRSLIGDLPEERGSNTYAQGKWTIKELLSHVIDGERIFAYRLLRISRADPTPLEGFEQDGYIENSNANARTFADLLDEFSLQRRSNILLLRNLTEEGWMRRGIANNVAVSVRALAFIMAGHVRHHQNILTERYLP
jgi:hypothetical protein